MEIEKSNVNIKLTLVIKYIAMALLIGIIVGIVDTIFGRGLLAISDFRTANYKYLIPFLPIAGLFIVWMYSYFSKVSLKGMTLVFSISIVISPYFYFLSYRQRENDCKQ